MKDNEFEEKIYNDPVINVLDEKYQQGEFRSAQDIRDYRTLKNNAYEPNKKEYTLQEASDVLKRQKEIDAMNQATFESSSRGSVGSTKEGELIHELEMDFKKQAADMEQKLKNEQRMWEYENNYLNNQLNNNKNLSQEQREALSQRLIKNQDRKKRIPEIEKIVNKNRTIQEQGIEKYLINQSATENIASTVEDVIDTTTSAAKKVKWADKESSTLISTIKNKSVMSKIMLGVNIAGSVGDYKKRRDEGQTVIESAAGAVGNFVVGEVAGPLLFPALGIVKAAPKAAVQTYMGVQNLQRNMNTTERLTPFGGSQFVDTQQLATMRQSGMELAKMSRYNLEQSLMGTEAKNLHRF